MTDKLINFFKPRGVALIGASSNPGKLSYGILKNMISYGYQGSVYPVNPGNQEILGLKCYPSISEVPDPVDLAVVILPAPAVPEVVEACGQRGLQAVNIISGGFREVGAEGYELEKRCLEIASRYQMRLIGPNCVGTMDLYSGLNTTFIRGVPDTGSIGFISQSGAVCGAVVDLVAGKGIGFSYFVSMGNEADVTETDLIEFLNKDENTRVIAAYVEAISDGPRFIRVASQVTRHKPIVILKAGHSDAGARAVSSHTGSLAGSIAAYDAAFRQSGVIVANTVAELFDISFALSVQPLPVGNRVAIVTNSGGPAALASDSLAANGLQLGDLSLDTKAKLREFLVPSAQVNNPVDMLGGATPEEYARALECVLKDPGIDTALVIQVPTSLVNPVESATKIGETAAKSEKPVIVCLMGDASIQEARNTLHRLKVPMYVYPEQAGRVYGAMLNYKRWLDTSPAGEMPGFSADRQMAQRQFDSVKAIKNIGEAHIRPLLQTYGIPLIPAELARSAEESVRHAEKLGYPVALKIVSPDILHKSDAGGIRLNLSTPQLVEQAYQEMMEKLAAAFPDARLEGVLVEPMAAKGHEVIVGMKRDPQFGPLMMFGLGGVYVELFTDVAFRVAPLNAQTALEMIFETKAGKLLKGVRGQKPADVEAVVDCILRLAQLALDFPEIAEVEVNPLLVFEQGKGATGLDARAILL
ncbi:MAG: acetate--CoA ligase family protein [Anaerolineae bacterium]|nr:acetate--CoA ligase family protein [Anaerolineae bacterium]